MNVKISHHILLCATPTTEACCNHSEGLATWNHLKEQIKRLNLENPNRTEGIILRSKVDCLRICKQGPIMLIWPDGVWYYNVTPKKIDMIISSHILNGNPIEEWILKRSEFATNH